MTTIASRLSVPSAGTRAAIAEGPISLAAFRAAAAELACLDEIEVLSLPAAGKAAPLVEARIVFWNAERLKYLAPSIELLAASHADAWLLCELDHGMARSGNLHTAAETARALGAGYAFAVEFVELGLGDARERAWHAGETNVAGLHGAALLSRHPLLRPRLVRLETSGRWFDGAFGERRVGGRIALMAELEVGTASVLLTSVHYESHTGPIDRRAQTRALLDAIDQLAPGRPVLIGGDFNTNTFERADRVDIAAACRADPARLALPIAYEPMFAELTARGFDWESCNVVGATTQRTRPDGTPKPPFGRIDWFFARGLRCREPAVIAAVDFDGNAISDHDALAVTIASKDG